WMLDDLNPFRELAKTKGETLKQPLKIFATAPAYQAQYRSYTGTHFITEDIFTGESKPRGAAMTLWVGKLEKPKGGGDSQATAGAGFGGGGFGGGFGGGRSRSGERAKVMVYDASGKAIRTYSAPIDSGMNKLYWDMRMDGVRFPSRQEARPDADLPGGLDVMPGTYKVVVSYGGSKDSTMLTVNGDPRLPIAEADRKAKAVAYEDFAKMVSTATDAFNRIREAQKTIKTVNDATANAAADTKKEITQLGKALQDSLSKLELRFLAPENQKGITRTSDNLSTRIFMASSYLNASDGAPTQSAKITIDAAKKELNDIVAQLNTFFSKDFAAYQQKVEAAQFSLFKKYEPIKVQ
ncbi:MAG: hypothetical protein ACK4TA_17060, partial [Saprospiraceae bacterium]